MPSALSRDSSSFSVAGASASAEKMTTDLVNRAQQGFEELREELLAQVRDVEGLSLALDKLQREKAEAQRALDAAAADLRTGRAGPGGGERVIHTLSGVLQRRFKAAKQDLAPQLAREGDEIRQTRVEDDPDGSLGAVIAASKRQLAQPFRVPKPHQTAGRASGGGQSGVTVIWRPVSLDAAVQTEQDSKGAGTLSLNTSADESFASVRTNSMRAKQKRSGRFEGSKSVLRTAKERQNGSFKSNCLNAGPATKALSPTTPQRSPASSPLSQRRLVRSNTSSRLILHLPQALSVLMRIKNSGVISGRPMSREALMPLLWQLIEDWQESAKEAEAALGAAVPAFAKVLYSHFLRQFGLHAIAEEKIHDLLASLEAHKSSCHRAQVIGRLIGLWKPLPPHGADFALALLSKLVAATLALNVPPRPFAAATSTAAAATAAVRRTVVDSASGGVDDGLSAYCATDAAAKVLPTLMSKEQTEAILTSVQDSAPPLDQRLTDGTTGKTPRVNLDLLLTNTLAEWSKSDEKEQRELTRELLSIFEAKLVNVGPITLNVFTEAVSQMRMPSTRILELYDLVIDESAASGAQLGVISADVFARVLEAPFREFKMRGRIKKLLNAHRLIRGNSAQISVAT
uniref:Uncharacterized protein n=1 Tax=Chrysotila carterae TaxID=13221 RepID=A0A7S4BE99_CHRCT